MPLQASVPLRNAMLDALAAAAGDGAVIEVRTGVAPIDCAAADEGTLLLTIPLGMGWATPAAGGQLFATGIPRPATPSASGAPGHFRLKTSGGACVLQGTAGAVPADLVLAPAVLAAGVGVDLSVFSFTAWGA